LPELFGNEWHERMKQTKQIIKIANRSITNRTVNALSVSRLNNFKEPRREFIPEQFIDSHKSFTQAIFTE
jgi:predicted transcriptional regulator YheO